MRFIGLEILGAMTLLLGLPACSVAPSGNDNNDTPANANDNAPPAEVHYAQAFGAADAGFLSAVWGSGPDDVFVVGGQSDAGEVYRYDGQNWSQMAIPDADALVWVYGFAANDVFAVGESGTILHYDGTRWRRQISPSSEDLWGVWGAAPDDVWAVGGSAGEGDDGVVILHYDGASWSAVEPPRLDREATSLFKIWGAAANKIFAVGSNGVIVEYDGVEWAQILVADVTDDIIALWGTSGSNIVAVGGRQQGVILRYDGMTWTGGRREGVEGLNGVFMTGRREAVVVGVNGEAGVYDLLADTHTRENSGTTRVLHAVWSDRSGRDYVVGGDSRKPSTGIAVVRTLEALPDNPSPPQPPPVLEPQIELGTGEGDAFTPLAAGDDIQVHTAGQGGTHVFLTFRGYNFANAVGARLTVAVVDDSNGFHLSGPSNFTLFLQDGDQGFYEQERLITFRVPPGYLTGQTATFTVTLTETASERSATVTASYRLLAP